MGSITDLKILQLLNLYVLCMQKDDLILLLLSSRDAVWVFSCPKRIILCGNFCYLQLQLNTKCPNEHIQQQDCSFSQLKKTKKKHNLEIPLVLLCGQPPTLLYLPMARPVRSHSRLHRCSSNRLVSVRFSPVRFTNWWAYTTWPGEKNR